MDEIERYSLEKKLQEIINVEFDDSYSDSSKLQSVLFRLRGLRNDVNGGKKL